MNPVLINATDISDAWFQCVWNILEKGRRYEVQHGSFEGETRLELDFAVIQISNAYHEPYDAMLPKIPAHLGIPDPVEAGYVEQYLPYLMTDHIEEGEAYTYGQRMINHEWIEGEAMVDCSRQASWWRHVRQVDHMIEILQKTPDTNQAILQVAQPQDCLLDDPPCLRHIDLRVMDSKLHFFPYFRSWDLWSGFPANLAGIAVLQKYMADEIGIQMGEIVASSKGLHIYGYAEELAKIRCYIMESEQE